jgi:hypothetical protein
VRATRATIGDAHLSSPSFDQKAHKRLILSDHNCALRNPSPSHLNALIPQSAVAEGSPDEIHTVLA